MTDQKLSKSLTAWTKFCSARTLAMTLICCSGASAQSGGGCLSDVSHEVRLRKVQTGPELGMASLAQRIVEEEESSDSECSRCPGDDQRCKCFMQGARSEIEGGNFDVLICARCRMGFDRYAVWHKGQPSPFYLTNTACWLPALSPEQGGRCNDRKEALA